MNACLLLLVTLATPWAQPVAAPPPPVARDWSVLPQLERRVGPPWPMTDPGALGPRGLGCATRTPGQPVTPACRVTLEARFGPAAVGPVRRPEPAAR